MCQLVLIAFRRRNCCQVLSARRCSRWSVSFCLWTWLSCIRKVGRFITCVICMWVRRAVSWVCYMYWVDWSERQSFVRWSIDFHRWVSRSCQCLFLSPNGGVVSDCCSAADNLWDVVVGQCLFFVSGVDLVSAFIEFVVFFVLRQMWSYIRNIRFFDGFCVRVQCLLAYLNVIDLVEKYKGSKLLPMHAFGHVCPYSTKDVLINVRYFRHFIGSLPVEGCKMLLQSLIVIRCIQQQYKVIDCEGLGAGFPFIVHFILMVRGDNVVHVFF